MPPSFSLSSDPAPRLKKRVPLDPRPRFKPDQQGQIDLIWGHLESQVPTEHLARSVWDVASQIDVSSVEKGYSALGRRGYPPRRLLALWVYASLVGEHEGSKVAARCESDSAFRWLCGGHVPSASTLNRFRQHNRPLFESAIIRTLELALQQDLIDVGDLAVDSVKLRAHASFKAVRTVERSTKRLKELASAALDTMTEAEREAHAKKVEKHQTALARCEEEDRTNIVLTNPAAGLIKGPYGASFPGHRVTVTAVGLQTRMVLSVLVDADGTDHGKMVPSLREARHNLQQAGHDLKARFVAAGDAGYFSDEELREAERERDWLEVFVAPADGHGPIAKKYFGRDRFTIIGDEPPVCPAGRAMAHAHTRPDGDVEWIGVGCTRCDLRPQCTPSTGSKGRLIRISPAIERMRRRMKEPASRARYARRIGTVEPVFAHLVDTMGYRRASTRHTQALHAEILLKFLAHNVARLIAARRLRLVYLVLDLF